GADIKSLSFNDTSFSEAYLGSDLVWKAHYNPVVHRFTKANTYHLTVPHWANTMDYVLIGGGGGGSAGDGSWRGTGDGGYAGSVKTGTSRVSQGKITVVVGAGGSGSSNTVYPQAESGGNTSISIGSTYFSASGGRGGYSNSGAHPAGARQKVNVPGFNLPQGHNAPPDSPGVYPGDGGGGGTGGYFNSYSPGQRGADGLAWIRFRKS
ncbi:glycine-rich domain-containing protein, partial [Corynebacterium diphtheriae]